MSLNATAQNLMANGLTAAYDRIGIADGSGTEAAGGSYARQTVAFASASGGVAAAAGNVTVPLPAGKWSRALLFNSTGPTALGFAWLGANQQQGVIANVSNLLSTIGAHGFIAGTPVAFLGTVNQSVPAGLSSGLLYYVIGTGLTATDFKVSASVGGAEVDITGAGICLVQQVVEITIPGGGGSIVIAAASNKVDVRAITA